MKSIAGVVLRICCTITLVTASTAFAQQKTIAQSQTELISAWLVTVEGEDRTRILRISGVAQKSDGTLLLEAVYGWADGNQTPVPASANQSGEVTKLLFTTQANSQIAATQTSTGTFDGTFTNKNGAVKLVRIQKISDGDLQSKITAAKAASRTSGTVVSPAAEVPKECAAFIGGWTGIWPGYGQKWLWIVEVNANCVARCAGSARSSAIPSSVQSCEIKSGVLAYQKPAGDMEYYTLRGDELWARYVPTVGNQNTTVYRKLQPSEK